MTVNRLITKSDNRKHWRAIITATSVSRLALHGNEDRNSFRKLCYKYKLQTIIILALVPPSVQTIIQQMKEEEKMKKEKKKDNTAPALAI